LRQNVIHLQRFYASKLGEAARAMVARRLDPLWPKDGDDMDGLDVLGFGYCAPYLMPYAGKPKKMIFAMPEEQGAMVSLSRRGNISCLVADDALPFPPASFDRILVAHGLEDTRHLPQLMSELWRVLKPEGQIVIIAPNRAGLWSRSDASPFGAGRPFSRGQLSGVLKAAKFTPTAWTGALYMPPSRRWSGAANGIERFGETVWPRFSGLILVRAIKRLYAHTDDGSAVQSRLPTFVGGRAARTGVSQRDYNLRRQHDLNKSQHDL